MDKKKKEMKKKIENIQSTYENKFNPTQKYKNLQDTILCLSY